ncbi:MAG: pentapeptide repeat-containing protein [Candidatus Brocadiales bacterium]
MANFTREAVIEKVRDGVGLRNAVLYGMDLSNANLHGANLRDADLKNSFLISADLEYADLTKADISGSNILHYKTHGWKIEGIKCTHVYNYPRGASGSERKKSRINFEKGQFEEKYKATPILEFLLSGVPQLSDQCKMYYIIREMNKKYNTGLEPASMKKESDGMLITLGAKSDQHLEEIGHMFVREYKKHDLDGKLLAIIEKEELLSSGVDSLDASDLFKQLLRVRVTLVNKGTINIIKE